MGTKQKDLHKSFDVAIRSLLAPCSKQEFCEAFPSFTAAEQEFLHSLFTRVITSLHGNLKDEFQSLCLETQVRTTMDNVQQMVLEQSMDPLFSDKTNVLDIAQNLSTTKKNEIQYFTEKLEKAEAENQLKRDRIELLKKERPDMLDMRNAVEKLRSGISSYVAATGSIVQDQ